MAAALLLLGVLFFLVLTFGVMALKVIQQYEKGIVFRLGRVQLGNVREPGLTAIVPFIDRIQKVNMQVVTMGVPAQEGITRDNISVRVDAVVYFRVVDPIKAVVNVQNYYYAVSQVAQTSLRSVIGKAEMDQLLSDREAINRELRGIIDEITEGPWGILIDRVEIKDVSLPEGMKRSMARQAEAERERRARIISADGEFQASKRLAAAANEMSRDPASLQLRLLQTVVEVAAEKNSTLIMPLPVELLRFFDKAAGDGGGADRQPASNQPVSNQPVSNQPVSNQPISGQPAVGRFADRPEIGRPEARGTTDPAEPAAIESVAEMPVASELAEPSGVPEVPETAGLGGGIADPAVPGELPGAFGADAAGFEPGSDFAPTRTLDLDSEPGAELGSEPESESALDSEPATGDIEGDATTSSDSVSPVKRPYGQRYGQPPYGKSPY